MDKITLAGGCFWCTEAIFKRLKGVTAVIPGYSGGEIKNPTYKQVCSGKTNHAEAVEVTFNPKVISLEMILNVFWHLHNPTTLNQQGADYGSQYRSAIFYHSSIQKEVSEKSKMQLEKSGVYKDQIVTQITPFKNFYPAEKYHKDYYENNKTAAYCQIVIDPKIKKLYKDYKELLK